MGLGQCARLRLGLGGATLGGELYARVVYQSSDSRLRKGISVPTLSRSTSMTTTTHGPSPTTIGADKNPAEPPVPAASQASPPTGTNVSTQGKTPTQGKTAAQGEQPAKGGTFPDDQLPKGMGWFSDKSGGLWAAVTTAFCVIVGGGAHLTLLSADLGGTQSGRITHWWPMFWSAVIPSSLIIGVIVWGLARQRGQNIKRNLCLGVVAAVATALTVAALFAVAWTSNNGHRVEWQPVVGTALAMVALGSFGGYFLASRRARVGLAASFVLTFLLLFSFMLTLQVLDVAANGSATAAGSTSASDVLGDFIKDFRGDVALIIGFYFGSDAAISVVKIFKSQGDDDAELGRMDRDLAAPRPATAPAAQASNSSPAF
jgi:hypothetical protein